MALCLSSSTAQAEVNSARHSKHAWLRWHTSRQMLASAGASEGRVWVARECTAALLLAGTACE